MTCDRAVEKAGGAEPAINQVSGNVPPPSSGKSAVISLKTVKEKLSRKEAARHFSEIIKLINYLK
jgi:hypothetical protein